MAWLQEREYKLRLRDRVHLSGRGGNVNFKEVRVLKR